EVAALLGIRILPEMGDQLVFLVQDRDAALEVGDDDVVAEDVQRAGVAQALERLADELAVEREGLEAMVRAVGHDDVGRGAALVDADAVRGRQAAALALGAVPGAEILALRVPLMHPALAVAVADVDVAV